MSTRAFLEEEDYDDFTDVPLKLHSVLDFLDTGAASVDGATERNNHVLSTDSESEEDSRGAETPKSLRLTPFIGAAALPRECYCLDKANCMCKLFDLPPLLTHKMPTLTALPAPLERVTPLSSSTAGGGGVATVVVTGVPPSVAESVHFVPLHLTHLELGKPAAATTASSSTPATTTRTSTRATCCRC